MRALALVSLALCACGPSWIVLRQAAPNPLSATTQLAMDNTTFDNVMVGRKSEPDYVAGKSGEQQAAYQNDKQGFVAGLVTAAQSRRGPLDIGGPDQLAGRFVVHTNVVTLEPGNFNGFFNLATEIRTRMLLTDPNQQPIDEIEVRCVVPADLYRPTVTIRLAECGRITGVQIARYLKRRTGVVD